MKKGSIKGIVGLIGIVVIGVMIIGIDLSQPIHSNAQENQFETKKTRPSINPNATTGKLKIRYLSVNKKGKELKSSVTTTNEIGSPYQAKIEKIKGYEFVGLSEGSAPSAGFYINGTQKVTFMYKAKEKTASKKGNLKVRYVDTNGVDIIAPRVITEKLGTHYKVSKVKFKGYTYKGLSGKSAPVTGKYKENEQEVCFEYQQDAFNTVSENGLRKLIVRYVDMNGNVIRKETESTGEIGSSYEVKQIPIYGYNFVQLADSSAPITGQYSKETTIVTYVYDKKSVK
ncbi:MucBP domain-containing protein [Vagococcus fessus]|uniref:MucBP domain-containing protein n=1 Tax=Vagococcus fessus TaxID=120370 RepID=A0A430A7M2_9ENTE|nr:MucBP domain-containing protein [Vagococcus fessus]RSU03074.1 hypothetical protein CBF31_04985 [Vagococcus fessus]